MPRLLAIPSLRNRLREALSQITVRYGPSTIVEEGGGPAGEARLRSAVRRTADWFAGGRGPSAGERAPDVRLRSRSADSPARLFDLFRDPRCVLLLFEGTSRHRGGRRPLTELVESTEAAYGRSVCVRVVSIDDIGAEADERTLADSDGAIHRRYGADVACCYLVRPDGYVGLRSRPLDPWALAEHLARTFATSGGAVRGQSTMLAEIGLGLSVVSAGLWSGLLLTVTTILHPMYARQDASAFAADMRRFLPIATQQR